MKRYYGVALIVTSMLAITSNLQAGSERWVMSMTTERMASEKIVHARFVDRAGHTLESDALKIMEIRKNDCEGGELISTPHGYKFGFDPETRLIGVMLPATTWMNSALCFTVKDTGKIKAQLDEKSQGKSIVLTLEE